MTATAAVRGAAGSAAWADTLLLSFAQGGYVQADPGILQPADPFLDLSGEDIRKSLYLTTDATGEELCLRPDLTIPVARDYLASGRAGQPAGFSYLGPVFRYRGGRPSEFLQAGIESFGRQDRAAADAEMLALALEATSAFGLKDVEIHTGDVALFTALIDALDLYPVWRRRLIKDFNRKVSLTDDIERLTLAAAPGRNEYEGVLAALAGSDRKAALALVTDLMSIAGTTNVGGRTVAENRRPLPRTIDAEGRRAAARRARHHQALPCDRGRSRRSGRAIACARGRRQARYLGRDRSVRKPRRLHGRARHRHRRRAVFHLVRPRARLLHRLRIRTARQGNTLGNGVEPLVAGGRYDGLMTQLGAPTPIPAVGFSVWIEALTQHARQGSVA